MPGWRRAIRPRGRTSRRGSPHPAITSRSWWWRRSSRMASAGSLSELKTRLREIADLRAAAAVLDWDQTTYMPEGGAQARGRQTALLSRLAHERWISPEIG